MFLGRSPPGSRASMVQAEMDTLDFLDSGLVGVTGASQVLAQLTRSPRARSLNCGQNRLGDEGATALVRGIAKLRAKGIGDKLSELSLASNGLTDMALESIVLNLLTASPHPPTLECLYLTNNTIELGSVSRDDSVPRLLGRALSSPNSTLRWISLTSNPRIGTFGFVALLDNLRLSATSAAAPSRFSQLHASVCGLMPDSAQPLASWLANPDCGGTRLQGLSLNGNYLSAPGVALVTKSLDDGRCTGLIHAEMLANDEVEAGDDGQTFDLARLEEAAAPITPATWREPLRDALDRNASLLRATRQEAASLLACARVVLMVAPEVHPDAATIRQQVERFSLSDTSPPADAPFPFLRLPVELQQHILRFVPLAKRDRAFQRGGVPASLLSTSDDDSQTFSALSERQFLRVLDYARSRQTLRREIVIHNNVRREARARGPGKSPTSKRPPAIGPRPRMSSAMYPSARSQCLEHFLATTLCDRWEPTNSITAAVAT